ncbi:methyltransferase [bacterium]|nr:methyltransferase [bacterium]
MTSKELVQKTLQFDSPSRIPRQKWILPWAEENFPQKVRRLKTLFPDDIVSAPAVYKKSLGTRGNPYKPGTYTDEWGCTFYNVEKGVMGKVKDPVIKDWDDLEKLKMPEALLSLDISKINEFCRNTDKFVIAGSPCRPFERYQFLRMPENTFLDIANRPSGFFELLKRIHEIYCRKAEVWAQTEVDALFLMDDWGSQEQMLVHPQTFREIFKPMYKDYIDISRKSGKYVFMHSDGYIFDILPDFVEIGIGALNSQVFSMGVEKLGQKLKGRITFWGQMDRLHLLPKGSPQEIKNAVFQIWNHLYSEGGVIAQCEFGPGARPENVFAVYKAWEEISSQIKS